jgi:SAM-dependent methyltransferase
MRYKCIGLLALFAWAGLVSARAQELDDYDVPYVPTPQNVVDTMLKLANLKPGDVIYDLGSGDGRIVITAAKQYGVRGVGIDINPVRIQQANENARKEGVAGMVTFKKNDLFEEDIHEATVVTIYLLPAVNLRLRPKLFKELKPGTRIISHDFDMGDWKPEKRVVVDDHRIFTWTIPGKQ